MSHLLELHLVNRGGVKSLRARDPSTKGTKDAKKWKRLELKGVNSVLPQQSSAGQKT